MIYIMDIIRYIPLNNFKFIKSLLERGLNNFGGWEYFINKMFNL